MSTRYWTARALGQGGRCTPPGAPQAGFWTSAAAAEAGRRRPNHRLHAPRPVGRVPPGGAACCGHVALKHDPVECIEGGRMSVRLCDLSAQAQFYKCVHVRSVFVPLCGDGRSSGETWTFGQYGLGRASWVVVTAVTCCRQHPTYQDVLRFLLDPHVWSVHVLCIRSCLLILASTTCRHGQARGPPPEARSAIRTLLWHHS